ncbi:unnamed protein product [Sphagnum troendelagicum]
MFLYIMRSYNVPVKKSTIQANYLLFQSERSPASDSFTSPSQDLNLLPSKIIVSNPQQQQQAILKELKCLFVDMVSKASQTVLLQQYCVLLSEFPNVIFHGSVEKSSMMMISAKDTWCGGGGGAKLNSEIKANVLPLTEAAEMAAVLGPQDFTSISPRTDEDLQDMSRLGAI